MYVFVLMLGLVAVGYALTAATYWRIHTGQRSPAGEARPEP